MTWEELSDEQLETLGKMYIKANYNAEAVARESKKAFGIYVRAEAVLDFARWRDLPVTPRGWKDGYAFGSREVHSSREAEEIIVAHESTKGNAFTASQRLPFSKRTIEDVWEYHELEPKKRDKKTERFDPVVDLFFHR